VSGIFTIMKKELRRFFTDTRMLVTVLLLPGLLIYVMYTVMGDAMGNMFTVEEDYVYRVGVAGDSDLLVYMNADVPVEYLDTRTGAYTDTLEAAQDPMTMLKEGELDLYVVFPDDFSDAFAGSVQNLNLPPHVAVYYNSNETASQGAYSLITALLEQLETHFRQKGFTVNTDPSLVYDAADADDTSAMFFSMLMPMFLTMLLFTGAQAVATESIAGEKERGTMATLLVTPLKRSAIAWGKIAALTIVAVSSGLVTTGFVVASLPKMMGGMLEVETSLYSVGDYILLGLVLISTAVVYVTLISLMSAFAKSVKEAQALVTPMMMLVILLGLSSMFTQSADPAWYWYLIPLYNSVQSITGIFAAAPDSVGILITTAVNLAAAGIGVWGLARMMNSEKVMFH